MTRNRRAFAAGWTVCARTAPTLLVVWMALSGVRPSPAAWLVLLVATVTCAVSKVAPPPFSPSAPRSVTGLETR